VPTYRVGGPPASKNQARGRRTLPSSSGHSDAAHRRGALNPACVTAMRPSGCRIEVGVDDAHCGLQRSRGHSCHSDPNQEAAVTTEIAAVEDHPPPPTRPGLKKGPPSASSAVLFMAVAKRAPDSRR